MMTMWTTSDSRAPRARLRAGAVVLLIALAAAPAGAQCVGDCDGDGAVAINELVTGVNIALGSAAVSACQSLDVDGSGAVEINELIAAVNNALSGCGPGSPTPTSTPTTAGGTATPTATPPASCGNGIPEFGQGETCDDGNRVEAPGDSCPANCHIASCQRSGQTLTVDVVFETDPSDQLVAGLTLFVRYPDGIVDVPGANNDPAVMAAVTSDFFSVTPNDSDYALTAVLIDPFFLGVNAGTAITVSFDLCTGATAPPAEAFSCRVIDASDPTPSTITDRVTCHVVRR